MIYFMGLALTHFALGAGGMQLILYVVAPEFRYRQSLVIASGLWALLPDIHYVLPVYKASLSELKFTVVGDLFWFHRALDALHPGRGTREMAAVMVMLLLFTTAVVEWRESSH